MLNKTVFAQNITVLAEIYDKTLTNTLQSVYYAVLQDMQDEDFKQAVKRLLQERVFATFPKPAEILSLSNVKKEVILEVDQNELKAKELIELVKGMNESVYQQHIKTGIRFNDLMNKVMFPTIEEETIAILNQVKPYCSYKLLVSNINAYQTSIEQLQAFKNALKFKETLAVVNVTEQLRIKK